MSFLFLLNGVVALLVSVFIAGGFLKHYKKDYVKKSTSWFSIIFFSYTFLLILYISWLLDPSSFNLEDYRLIYAVAILVQTLVILKTVHNLTHKKNILYISATYLILFLLVTTFSFQSILSLSLIISFLLTLFASLNFINTARVCKRLGYTGVVYSCLSLVLEFILFFNKGSMPFFYLISSLTFLVFVFFFLKDIKKYPILLKEEIPTKEEAHILLFIKYFVYIIVITNLTLMSTIGVHELSHVLTSRYYECESRAIAFEEGIYPYSEIVCDNLDGKIPITASGPVIPVIVAIFLLIAGGRFVKPISFLIIGFNLLASHKDLMELGVGETLVLASSVAGIIFLFIGITLSAKSRMHEHNHIA